ncbi:MAG: hypothetical protein Q4C89_10710 [Deinococcus sp.]|uniref:hypothetical protein n=1 Tax=Deinococcus sp. TaxID=47478 RepID=UPI0026DD852A|nr:hypothetical protein [Deinococcus sp.]MDO4246484.1 hypothetical protein [Deinococcus sp.]
MPRISLFCLGLGLLLTACGNSPSEGVKPDTATIALLSEKERGEVILNDELLELSVDLKGLTDVQKVVFYRNSQVLGEDTTAPYTWRDEVNDNSKAIYQAVAYTKNGRDFSNTLELTPNLKPRLTRLSGTLYDADSLDYPLQTALWKGGQGEMLLKVGGTVVARGPLAADGKFDMTLLNPANGLLTAATPENLYAFTGLQGCTGKVVANAATANTSPRLALAHAEVAATRSGVAAPVDVLPPTPVDIGGQVKQISYLYTGALVYATNAVNMEGSLSCPRTTNVNTTLDFRLSLAKGWNKITQQYTLNPNDPRLGKLIFSTGFPKEEKWVVLPTNLGLPLVR